ncbi:MAG TPA: tape measure protein [Kurthia sp.]
MAKKRVISAVLTLKDKDFSSGVGKAANKTTDFERKMRQSSNAVTSFGRSGVSAFKSVALGATAIVGAIGITKALSGAFNMVKSSVGSAFDRIDTMEAFKSTLTVLTGSAEKTQKALDATRESVKGTAYGLNVAAKSVQDFVTRGMKVDDATKTLAQWGDAVAFYGDGSNEQLASVTDALAKMYSSGKVGMDQMNTLFDAGIDGVGTYAKAVGRDTASVQKDLSGGKISASEFIDVVGTAFEKGTNGVVKIAGAAKGAGASWGSVFSNMQAAVTRGTETIILKIDEMLVANGLPDMRSMVSQFGSTFESVLSSIADKIPVVTGYLVNMYTAAQPGLDYIKDTALPAIRDGIGYVVDKATEMYNFIATNWSTLGPVVAGVAAAVATFKIGVMAISAAQTTWTVVTSGLQIATALLNGTLALSPLGWVAIAIGAVIAAGVLLWQNWDTVKASANALWTSLKTSFSNAKAAVIDFAEPVISFFDRMMAKWNSFKNSVSSFKMPKISLPSMESIKEKIPGFATGTNSAPGGIAQVHEKGGEIIDLPRGSRVYPHDKSVAMARAEGAQSSGGNVFTININGSGKSTNEIVNELVPALQSRLANI